jgi:hypothetical protein
MLETLRAVSLNPLPKHGIGPSALLYVFFHVFLGLHPRLVWSRAFGAQQPAFYQEIAVSPLSPEPLQISL